MKAITKIKNHIYKDVFIKKYKRAAKIMSNDKFNSGCCHALWLSNKQKNSVDSMLLHDAFNEVFHPQEDDHDAFYFGPFSDECNKKARSIALLLMIELLKEGK